MSGALAVGKVTWDAYPMSRELEAACRGEIDLIPACEVGPDLIEELEEWSEIGWVILDCGCLASPDGASLVHEHIKPERDWRE